tara:strand:- start:464 stop:1489 length:1026 start_codon:yes stop_codon:yes gene_type:complete
MGSGASTAGQLSDEAVKQAMKEALAANPERIATLLTEAQRELAEERAAMAHGTNDTANAFAVGTSSNHAHDNSAAAGAAAENSTVTAAAASCDVDATLAAHNALRALHGGNALVWSDECAAAAAQCAAACGARGAMEHSHYSEFKHGQNIYYSSEPRYATEAAAVQMWYDEVNDPGHDHAIIAMQTGTGHYTQVVWRGTTHVGMARDASGCFVVANYSPPGNVEGLFARNVLAEGVAPPTNEIDDVALRASGESVVATRKSSLAGGAADAAEAAEAALTAATIESILRAAPHMRDAAAAALDDAALKVTLTYRPGSLELKVEEMVEGGGRSCRIQSSSWSA